MKFKTHMSRMVLHYPGNDSGHRIAGKRPLTSRGKEKLCAAYLLAFDPQISADKEDRFSCLRHVILACAICLRARDDSPIRRQLKLNLNGSRFDGIDVGRQQVSQHEVSTLLVQPGNV